MEFLKVFLGVLILASVFEWTEGAGLLEGCSSASCGAGLVCEAYYSPESSFCKVRADGMTTGCNNTDALCPYFSVCNSNDTCSCKPGTRAENGICPPIHSLPCSSDSDCTGGIPGPTYRCKITNPCTTGVCWCDNESFELDCIPLGYGDVCDAADDQCEVTRGLACNNATLRCACSDNSTSYRSVIGECTSKAVFGESCSNHTDCFAYPGYPSRDGYCGLNGTCGCTPGYIPKVKQYTDIIGRQTCLSPYAGDDCTSTCFKASSSVLASDTSQGTPNCSSSRCVCNPGYSTMPVVTPFYGCKDICVADANATTLPVGANCTSFNECGAEGICLQCPGDLNGKCYMSPCVTNVGGLGGAGIAAIKGITLVLLVVLVFLLSH